MKKYLLDSGGGTMCEKEIKESAENLRENQSWVILSTLNEFESNEMMHSCKKDLLHSLN